MGTGTKGRIDAAKTVSIRLVQKTAKAAGDLVGNTIADKITSAGKTKKEKKKWKQMKQKKCTYQPTKAANYSFFNMFQLYNIKMEYQKLTNLLGNIPDKESKFVTKKWVEVYDQSGDADNRYKRNKQVRFKTSMLQLNVCDHSDGYTAAKGTINIAEPNHAAYEEKNHL